MVFEIPNPRRTPLFPSPGTPGEGQGGGSSLLARNFCASEKNPHPSPPPEYRGRGKGARIAVVLALMMLMMVVGCDRSNSSSTSSGTPAPLTELRLGYFANATHAQAVLGVESGDFAQAITPTKLSTKIFNAGPSLIEALFAKEVDIGYIGPG